MTAHAAIDMEQQSWSRPLRVNWLTMNGNRRRTYKTTTERVPVKQNALVKQNGLRGGFTRRLKPPPPPPQQVKVHIKQTIVLVILASQTIKKE